MTTTNNTREQRLEMARCCKLAGVIFIGISHNLLYFKRAEGLPNILRMPLREVTPLTIMLELCMDAQHTRETTTKPVAEPAQQSRHLFAAEGN